jgi:hypothetical protein
VGHWRPILKFNRALVNKGENPKEKTQRRKPEHFYFALTQRRTEENGFAVNAGTQTEGETERRNASAVLLIQGLIGSLPLALGSVAKGNAESFPEFNSAR